MNAAEFSKHVWVMLIGIGDFKHQQLVSLSSPAVDTIKLKSAFIDPFGLAIPVDQVQLLLNDSATKEEILSALTATVQSVTPHDILIIYFTGHGMRDEANFYLCPYDVDTAALPKTAVNSTELETVLNQSSARGVLLILDCCRSASFSELAPNFFKVLADKDFKILLSASRSQEPSWELSQGQGTIFSNVLCKVLSGKDQISSSAGLVYFSELIKHLQDQVREELEVNHPDVPVQEPIFTGSYAKDPLLFVHHRLTLSQVSIRTLRYSRAFIRRKIRQVLLAVAIVLCMSFGIIYSILDNSQYIALENGAVALYSGLPKFNFLSFPERVWIFEFQEDDVKENSPLAKNKVVKAALSNDALPLLADQLKPAALALLLHWQQRNQEAIQIIASFLSDTVSTAKEDQQKALEALNRIEGKININLLSFYSRSPDLDLRTEALKAYFRITPDRAKDIAIKDPSLWAAGTMIQDILHNQVVQSIDTCSPAINEYFTFLLSEALNSTHRLILENLLENKCEITAENIIKCHLKITVDDFGDDLANYTILQSLDKQRLICEQLSKIVRTSDNPEVKKVILKTLYKAAIPRDPAICWNMLTENNSGVRHEALRIILANRFYTKKQVGKLLRSFGSDLKALCLLVQYGVVDWKKLRSFFSPDDVSISEDILSALQAVAVKDKQSIGSYLIEQLKDPKLYYRVKQLILEALDNIDYATPNLESFLNDDYASVQEPALRLYTRDSFNGALNLMVHRLNDKYLDQVINFFIRHPMPDSVLKVVKQKYANEVPNETVIALIAMHGKTQDCIDLINNTSPTIRIQAASYLICNPNRKEILNAQKFLSKLPSSAVSFLQEQDKLFSWLQQEIKRTPDGLKAWRGFQLIRNHSNDLSEGLKLRITAMVEAKQIK